MEFKDQIKYARETVHMSQQEFAAAIGVAHSSLNRWELGMKTIGRFIKWLELIDFEERNDN